MTRSDEPPDQTFAEFFAGIGLMRLGLEREGWKVAWANDNDPQKLQMYETHFGEARGYHRAEDIRAIKGDDVPSVALATASFPCNDLSLAGARAGLAGRHSSMFWEFTRILAEMGRRRPRLVLLENVHGFLTSHGGRDMLGALLRLNELGYLVDVLRIDAAHFVPQSRVRLFVIGWSGSLGREGGAPARVESGENSARPREIAQFISEHPEVRWGLRDVPPLPRGRRRLADVLETVPEDSPIWWSAQRAEYLLAQMSPTHREKARAMIASKSEQCGTVFRRMRHGRSMAELRTDGIAGCLRTPRGGSARQILFLGGRGGCRVRLLTPRENARLMGAGEYRIATTTTKALFGFGDAVCVPVVQWIAREHLASLLGHRRSAV